MDNGSSAGVYGVRPDSGGGNCTLCIKMTASRLGNTIIFHQPASIRSEAWTAWNLSESTCVLQMSTPSMIHRVVIDLTLESRRIKFDISNHERRCEKIKSFMARPTIRVVGGPFRVSASRL